MAMVEEIGTFLAAAGVGTLGTDLFIDNMPDSPDTCVAVIESIVGLPPTRTLGSGLPVTEMPRFQVYARAASKTTAHAKAKAAWDALEVVADQTLSGTRYERIEALQSPFLLKRDDADRWVFLANFQAHRVYS